MPTEPERETNILVAGLPEAEGRRFAGRCSHITLNPGDVLCEPHQPMQAAYFPRSGAIALATVLGDRPPLQLGLLGRDAMLGATTAFAVLVAPMRAVVQVAGTALAIAIPQFQQALRASPRLLMVIHHCQYRLMMQALQTAACMQFHEIEPRLARCLLMTQDLNPTDNVCFTHHLLAQALGVRRSGVTLAAGSLQRKGLIRYSRGEIHILDRAGLEADACECYSVLNDNYQRVFG